ncbi:DUF192 domain-containing protein [Aliiglaciecola sp. CAU 1673]|uniref:DUF192 domain-containing protein n=1 Tax=Aliiglaciecola sp. CAU 1673 TaxID=3032595 RepID=UPI0023DC7A5E|nr:DUF192 domain-containing protein [Aliiglaciecola sp. CAU 1673]MDF2179521.1 DUF192 domain-containing protein [Aliiglaciecola sp. CAU 1673]
MTRWVLFLVWFSCSWACASQIQFGTVQVKIKDRVLKLELAEAFEERAQGLMFRPELCEDCGMIFSYEQPKVISMWMKNTLIPLDVAFVDEHGRIIAIKPMEPHDLRSVSSEVLAKYALEMNQGWFARNQIRVGDKVSITR